MLIDPVKVHARCKARETAEALADLVIAEHAALSSDPAEAFAASFAGRMIQAGIVVTPPAAEPTVEPLSDAESRYVGKLSMPFGRHCGEQIDQVPLDYLIWLVEQPDDFKVSLKRYIKSQRIQREQE